MTTVWDNQQDIDYFIYENTEEYLKEKTKKAIAELIKSADAFNKKEQLEEERKGKEKNNGV